MRCLATWLVAVLSAGVSPAVTIDHMRVGNPGNADDTRHELPGHGHVDYAFRIGTYEVTNSQYAEFLNAVAAVGDANDLYHIDMGGGWNDIGGIIRHPAAGTPVDPWIYESREDRADRPVNYVSWYNALRFANWLHNGQPSGGQDDTTTEDGAYDMSLGSDVVRRPSALVFLPSEHEWYKAAYYDPILNGGTGGYWDYPTQSNPKPTNEIPPGTDLINGSANYRGFSYVDTTYYTTEVGAYDAKPSDSAFGTFDQGGNVWEWNEADTLGDGSFRGLRGGSFATREDFLLAERHSFTEPMYGTFGIGFRVASITEPLVLGDMNDDGQVNGLDVGRFVSAVIDGSFNPYADMTGNDGPNGLDIGPFIEAVIAGGAAAVPEPSTLAMALALLGLLCWRRAGR